MLEPTFSENWTQNFVADIMLSRRKDSATNITILQMTEHPYQRKLHSLKFWEFFWFFKKYFGWHVLFYSVSIETPVLDFRWRLLFVSNPEWATLLTHRWSPSQPQPASASATSASAYFLQAGGGGGRGKVKFLHLSVILSRGSVCACLWSRGSVCHTPWADTPQAETPMGKHLPWSHPLRQTPPWADTLPGQTPFLGRHSPPRQCMLEYN